MKKDSTDAGRRDYLTDLLKDSGYRLTQFRGDAVAALEGRIVERNGKRFVCCLVRKKEFLLKPEEAIRQLYLATLLDDLAYPPARVAVEYGVSFGRETKRADEPLGNHHMIGI